MMFYEIFSELCKAHGLTVTRAALEIGLSKGNVSYWKRQYKEGKEARPDSYTAEKIAAFFGVSVDYLLGRTDDPINYDADGDAIAEIPQVYIDAADGDIRKARALMLAAHADALQEAAIMRSQPRQFSREDAKLIFALWGDQGGDIDDKDLEDVRRFAAFLKDRKKDNDNS